MGFNFNKSHSEMPQQMSPRKKDFLVFIAIRPSTSFFLSAEEILLIFCSQVFYGQNIFNTSSMGRRHPIGPLQTEHNPQIINSQKPSKDRQNITKRSSIDGFNRPSNRTLNRSSVERRSLKDLLQTVDTRQAFYREKTFKRCSVDGRPSSCALQTADLKEVFYKQKIFNSPLQTDGLQQIFH